VQRQMMKSEIHRATVAACDVDFVGSITIDAEVDTYPPVVVHVDEANDVTAVDSGPSVLLT
jgi:aspartate 1-decarboxylase